MNFPPLAEPNPNSLGEVKVSQQTAAKKCDYDDDDDNNNNNKLM